MVAVLAGVCAIAAVVTSATDKLPSQLRIGGPLATVVALLAVLAPQLEQRLKQAQEALTTKDRQLDREIKRLAQRSRPDLLAQVRRYWVETELEGSLQKLARIKLGLAERPAAVDYALRALLRRPDEPDRLLESGQPISDIYREFGKQLLILGGPGAGKTTLLLDLTQHLLEQAEAAPAEAMPVVFQLSTWALERQPLATWLVDELRKRYGVSRALGDFWLNTEQIVPLLDGLDEVTAEHLAACMTAINEFHNAHGLLPLVICSRIVEYEALQAKLQLRGAIVIQPLTRAEVDRYLRQAGRPLAGVRAVLRDDEQLRELLTTPLFLSIVALAYEGRPAVAVRASGSLQERRRRVLADYVEAMFHRPKAIAKPTPYSREQTEAWLNWLAGAMRAHDQSVFYLDWMQPDWLPTQTQRRLVTTGIAAGTGLSCALAVWLASGLSIGLVFGSGLGLIAGLVIALLSGLMVGRIGYDTTIAPSERLRWSRSALRRKFGRWLLRGWLGTELVVALVGALVAVNSSGPAGPITLFIIGLIGSGVFIGLPAGLIVGLVCGLISGLEPMGYVTPPAPGEAIQRSKRNALVSGLPIALIFGLPAGLVAAVAHVGLTHVGLTPGLAAGQGIGFQLGQVAGAVANFLGDAGLNEPRIGVGLSVVAVLWLFIGPPAGLIFGFIVGLQRGGGVYLRHVALRWLLSRNQLAPRDYVAFLEHATGLILLRRRGGGYEFIHRLLLEYFASLEDRWPAVDQSVSPLAASADAGQQHAKPPTP